MTGLIELYLLSGKTRVVGRWEQLVRWRQQTDMPRTSGVAPILSTLCSEPRSELE